MSDLTPDMLAVPRFDDGAIDMQELLRRLAEQVANAVMDAEADQLCSGGANELSRLYRQKAQQRANRSRSRGNLWYVQKWPVNSNDERPIGREIGNV